MLGPHATAMLASPPCLDHARSICCVVTVVAQVPNVTAGCLPRVPSHGILTGSRTDAVGLVGVVGGERVQAPRVQCVRLSGEVGHQVTAG